MTTWNLSPYILCLLASMVKDDVEVKIIDSQFYDLSVEEFIKQVDEFSPDYVGISILTSEYENTLDITAAAVKAWNPEAIVIAGGVHVSIEYEKVIENHNIDYAIRGEGEYVLQHLIKYLNGSSDQLPKEGLVFRSNDEVIIQKHTLIEDLTILPWPDLSLVKMEDYLTTAARNGPLRAPEYPSLRWVVTRGCPVGCSFCQVEFISGRSVRTRDPEDVVNELIFMKEKYGLKSVIFEDDNISLPRKFFMRLLELFIEKELNLKFIHNSFAIFTVNDAMLDLMARAGCQGLNVAIETGNQRVMKEVVMKPVTLSKIPDKIKKIQEKGMFVIANFIVGYPGEKWDEILDTIRFAEHCLADYIKIFVAVPLKGTKMWDLAIRLDALEPAVEDYRVDWRYGQIRSDEWTPKDISILRAYEWDRINFGTAERRKRVAEIWGFSVEEMAEIRKRTRDALNFDANLVSNATPQLLLGKERRREETVSA